MLTPVPIPCLFTSQLMCSVISQTQRMEQSVELLCIREVKNQPLKFLCIFHRILNGIADLLYMEKALKVIEVSKEEVKQVVEITPLTEYQRQFIRLIIFVPYRPKVIISRYSTYEFHKFSLLDGANI